MACMTRKYLTTKEVADSLSTKNVAIRRWIRQGRMKAINIGTDNRPVYRVDEAELVRFTEARAA